MGYYERLERTELLIGMEALDKLKNANILLFGVGGVGGMCLEALVRSGIGHITIVDGDVVSESNLNRQIIATTENIGRPKVEVAAERMLLINPDLEILPQNIFYLPRSEGADSLYFACYDFVIDAIDNVSAKLDIIERCKNLGVPIISSMGTGNKLGMEHFKITDISKTQICPLAKVIRKELRKRGISDVSVLYSEEIPRKNDKGFPASISFVPPMAGLEIAGYVIRKLTGSL